jgi:DNA-binding MurR/RpiR family transcriptional regulator
MLDTGAPLDVVLRQIMAGDTGAMRDTAARLDLRAVDAAAEAVAAARRVDIHGATSSALVGGELCFCLHRIGVAAWSWTDVHDGLASAATLGSRDVAIGLSHSGENRATIEILAEAGSHGATTVALTSFARSPLADVADVVLLTAVQATPLRPDALAARHAQMVVLDLLYIAVAQRLHGKANAAFRATARAVDAHRMLPGGR